MPCVLPNELLRRIAVQAASEDTETSQSLAYVSRQVCCWTAVARWRTVVITEPDALVRLMQALHSFAQPGATLLSVPCSDPGVHTRNLFIDTSVSVPTLQQHLDSSGAVAPDTLLRHFPHVRVLALGSAELALFLPSMRAVSPVSLTLVHSGDEALLHDALQCVRRRLEYLHVVGADPESELTGVPMPISVLEPLVAGSTSPESFLHDTWLPHVPEERTPGVKHLRYDTRKFSFRPTEILASRLRPFFQELCVRDESRAGAERAVEQLRALGCGGLRRLQLCWRNDPPSAENAPGAPLPPQRTGGVAGARSVLERSTMEQRSRLNSSLYTGDWPMELRGAWTDRSHPHTSVHEAFRAEFKESIANLYGWYLRLHRGAGAWMFPDGAYCDRIVEGFTPRDRERLERVQLRLCEQLDEPVDLVFRVRTPSEFVALGTEQAALFPDERLLLFYRYTGS